MAFLDLLILQKHKTGIHHMALDLLICKMKRKPAKLELHNMVSVELPFLWTSIWSMSNSIASKIPEKRINNLKAFSSVKSEIQQNTHCLLTVSRISSTIFRKLKWPLIIYLLGWSAWCSRIMAGEFMISGRGRAAMAAPTLKHGPRLWPRLNC